MVATGLLRCPACTGALPGALASAEEQLGLRWGWGKECMGRVGASAVRSFKVSILVGASEVLARQASTWKAAS